MLEVVEPLKDLSDRIERLMMGLLNRGEATPSALRKLPLWLTPSLSMLMTCEEDRLVLAAENRLPVKPSKDSSPAEFSSRSPEGLMYAEQGDSGFKKLDSMVSTARLAAHSSPPAASAQRPASAKTSVRTGQRPPHFSLRPPKKNLRYTRKRIFAVFGLFASLGPRAHRSRKRTFASAGALRDVCER